MSADSVNKVSPQERHDQLYDAVLKDIQECAALTLADEDATVAVLCEKSAENDVNVVVSAKLSAAEKRKQELNGMVDKLYQGWMSATSIV